MAKILAFDQATRTTGWSLFENGELITYGKFSLGDADFGVRLLKFKQKVQELVEAHQPDKVYFEDIQQQENVDTFKKLAEIFGVLYEYLMEIDMPNESVLAGTWRSGLGIKGKTRPEYKKATKEWVALTYSVKATEDESDAIAIGAYGAKQKKVDFARNEGLSWS